jgi:MFS family permease
MSELFSNSQYRKFFSARVVALFGNGLATIALALLAFHLAGKHAGLVLGIALSIKMLVYISVAPVAGALAQYLPKKAMLVSMDCFRFLLMLCFPFISHVWEIYLGVFFLSASSACFTPVYQAALPELIKEEGQYAKALSYSRMAGNMETIASPILAALLLGALHFNFLFFIKSATYLLSALLLLLTALPAVKVTAKRKEFWQQITSGMRIYFSVKALREMLLLFLIVAFGGAMVIVNTVVYVQHYLQLGQSFTAFSFAAFGVGSVLAAFLTPRVVKGIAVNKLMKLAALLIVISLALLIFMPGWPGLLVGWWTIGLGSAFIETPAGLVLNEHCNASNRAPIYSAHFALTHGCWLVGYFLAGVVGGLVGLQWTFVLLAVFGGLICLFQMPLVGRLLVR